MRQYGSFFITNVIVWYVLLCRARSERALNIALYLHARFKWYAILKGPNLLAVLTQEDNLLRFYNLFALRHTRWTLSTPFGIWIVNAANMRGGQIIFYFILHQVCRKEMAKTHVRIAHTKTVLALISHFIGATNIPNNLMRGNCQYHVMTCPF